MRGVVILLLIHLVKQIQILDAFILSCNASLQTVKRVPMCPSDMSAYEEAVKKKNCSSTAADAHACESFEYHCVLSDDLKYAIEVCAPGMYIVGYACTKFSTSFQSIIRIDDFPCNDSTIQCPYRYNSTLAFRQTLCYANITYPLTTDSAPRSKNSKLLFILFLLLVPLAIGIFICRRQWIEVRRQKAPKPNDIEMMGRGNGNTSIGDQTSDPLLPGDRHTPNNEHQTDSPGIFQSNQPITMGIDIMGKAVLKTKIFTTKKEDNIVLQAEVNFLLDTLRNPNKSWKKDELVTKVDEMAKKLCKREEFGLLKDLCTAINEDENVNKTLRSCQKKMCKTLNSVEKKYHSKINVSEGCVCVTFCFDNDTDFESFLVKLKEEEDEIRRDISEFMLDKTLMGVFHVDSRHVSLVISKVTVNKGSILVYQKDCLKSTIAEDAVTAKDNSGEDYIKRAISESQTTQLESKFNSVLSSLKNPESMQERDLISMVKDMLYELRNNKRMDLIKQFAIAFMDKEIQTTVRQYGLNMSPTLIPIFEDLLGKLNIRGAHQLGTETDIDTHDEEVANRFESSERKSYPGYMLYRSRALSFDSATTWMKARKREFAKFGFLYGGIGLKTFCFHCGCFKDDWTEDDDILAKHLLLEESCAYANYISSTIPSSH